jgi:uncharacterized protein DUF4157
MLMTSAAGHTQTAVAGKQPPSAASRSAKERDASPALSNRQLIEQFSPVGSAKNKECDDCPCPECEAGEDERAERQPGSWLSEAKKPAFLAALREAVCVTADEGMAGTGSTSQGCPWIGFWFTQYESRSAAHVERAIRKFAPETGDATSEREVIPIVAARVRRSVDQWANSGDITGLPESIPLELPGMGMLGGLFFQGRGSAARSRPNPVEVRARMGAGKPIAGSARARMESAFGASFVNVRVHDGPSAASLAERFQARAFTVGENVGFAGGEYNPGTPVGDAILAHELAHVLQQGNFTQSANVTSQSSFEMDADRSAMGVMNNLWGGESARAPFPGLNSGLRLQRCGSSQPAVRSGPGSSECPALPQAPAPRPGSGAGRNPMDQTAARIVALARNEAIPIEQRGPQLVRAIICQYYPQELQKVSNVDFDPSLSSGLATTSVGRGPNARGIIHASRHFVENANDNFAHEVLRVKHELEHIDQYRQGMTGSDRKQEREFLAHAHAALAGEEPGTGTVRPSTRVSMIDQALRQYYCFDQAKKDEHAGLRDQILARRSEMQPMVDNPSDPPATCGTGAE